MARPPFANVAAYAAALAELVPDTKGTRTDDDLIADAIEEYAERYPSWETAGIGDDATSEWELGAAPFLNFAVGYSDLFLVRVEELDTDNTPQKPPVFLTDASFWLENRFVGGEPKRFLVFDTAPSATGKARVHWRRQWDAALIPLVHQMVVVHFAASLKCTALASRYRKTVDAGTGIFDGVEVADGYERDARKWRAKALSRLGVGSKTGVRRGRVRSQRVRVFDQEVP